MKKISVWLVFFLVTLSCGLCVYALEEPFIIVEDEIEEHLEEEQLEEYFEEAGEPLEVSNSKFVGLDLNITMAESEITLYKDEIYILTAAAYDYGEPMTIHAAWAENNSLVYGYINTDFSIDYKRESSFMFNANNYEVDNTYKISFIINPYELEGINRKEVSCYVTVIDYPPEHYERLNRERVLSIVTPANVTAIVNKNSSFCSDRNLKNKIQTVEKGTEVIYDTHHKNISAHVILPDGSAGWVGYYNIDPSTKNFTISEDFSQEDKVTFVNAKGYTSDTDYLVWINIQRQRINVFLKSEEGWKLEREMLCATGTNRMPTVVGEFTYLYRDNIWNFGAYNVQPALIFYENYAMHSVLLKSNGSIYDGTLGTPASHGCVRLAVDDINWLDYFLPRGSKIVVY